VCRSRVTWELAIEHSAQAKMPFDPRVAGSNPAGALTSFGPHLPTRDETHRRLRRGERVRLRAVQRGASGGSGLRVERSSQLFSCAVLSRRGRQSVAADTCGRPRRGAGIERGRPRRDHQCTDRAPDQTSAVAHRVLLGAHGAACASGKRCEKKAEVTTAGDAPAVRHVEQNCVMWSSTLDWWRRERA
jgi:hypothetical protein